MKDYLTIGSAPCEEDCVCVSTDMPYLTEMREESRRFIDLIRRVLGPEPGSARLAIKTFDHDYGPYVEVVCYFDDQDEAAVEYAFKCESEAPSKWDSQSRAS
jgi:hypothetical protein